VSGTRDLSRESVAGRSSPDAPWFSVAGLGATSATVTAAPVGLAPDDEALLINLQGSPGAIARVGAYEFLRVASVVGSTVTFSTAVTGTYGSTSNASLAGQVVALVRVPAYSRLTLRAGAVLNTTPFDGRLGGVLAFRVAGDLTVPSGARLDMAARGYRGGPTGAVYDQDSYQGESRPGRGCGGQVSSCSTGYLNSACNACWQNNDGGGGASVTGGGGNYGGGATPGVSWNGGGASPPGAGGPYGVANLAALHLGSGGGGVWRGNPTGPYTPGPGGNGGGAVFFTALRASLGPGAVTVAGETCVSGAQGSWTYGCGGGAGGSLYLRVQALTVTGVAGLGVGGAGTSSGLIRPGGNGGVGRSRVDVGTVNGFAAGTSDANTALVSAFEPDPGFVAAAP
jgi:hypothetical protein